jgi:hypothetical protein
VGEAEYISENLYILDIFPKAISRPQNKLFIRSQNQECSKPSEWGSILLKRLMQNMNFFLITIDEWNKLPDESWAIVPMQIFEIILKKLIQENLPIKWEIQNDKEDARNLLE